MDDYLDISVYQGGDDFALFESVINQGIDARLEAFTQSEFIPFVLNSRWHFKIHPNEVSILLRRLLELEDEYADDWANDIVESYYGQEDC